MDRKLKILVLEDDIQQYRLLEKILKSHYSASDIIFCANLNEFTKAINDKNYDVLLLDIEVEKENSIMHIEKLVKLNPELSSRIIYITAHKQYAMDAMNRTHSFGFIEKPYDGKDIIDAINACITHNNIIEKKELFFKFKIKGKSHFVNKKHILFIELKGKKPLLYTLNQVFYLPRTPVTLLVEHLNGEESDSFLRCRRDSIVNLNHILHVKNVGKIHYAVLTNGYELPIGDKYKDIVFRRLSF